MRFKKSELRFKKQEVEAVERQSMQDTEALTGKEPKENNIFEPLVKAVR